MKERGEKYISDKLTMSTDEQAGVEFSNKKLSEKRLEKFKKGIEKVKDRGLYDETDLRRDTEETTDRCKEIITLLESVYTGKGKKKEKEWEEKDYCFVFITKRRDTVIKMVKVANTVVETIRNALEAAKAEEEKSENRGDRNSEGPRPGEEKQFKKPTGTLTQKIS